MMHRQTQSAFTLVELSIVMVVIGLLVGTILGSQTMIKAAMMRKQISQFNEVNVSTQAFKLKYKALPGDIRNASQSGLYAGGSSPGGDGAGDGNDLIEQFGGNSAACVNRFTGEIVLYWRHLGEAGFISQKFTDDAIEGWMGGTMIPGPGLSFPSSKLYNDSGIIVSALPPDCGTSTGTPAAAEGRLHYIVTGAVAALNNQRDARWGSDWWTNNLGFTPMESYELDKKMDDGRPMTGIVQARFAYAIHNILPAANNSWAIGCVVADAGSYDTSLTGRVCRLRVQTTF